jgi:hypothetical protein
VGIAGAAIVETGTMVASSVGMPGTSLPIVPVHAESVSFYYLWKFILEERLINNPVSASKGTKHQLGEPLRHL